MSRAPVLGILLFVENQIKTDSVAKAVGQTENSMWSLGEVFLYSVHQTSAVRVSPLR